MLKPLMLLGVAAIAMPALAQNKPAPDSNLPGRTPVAAAPVTPASDPATPAPIAPADPAVAQQQTPAVPADVVTAQPVPAAQPATAGEQVAAVVDSEFPTYDKDGDGKLNKAEFGAWMLSLKAKSDPATKPDAAATKTWVAGAFKQADTDKSAAVSKTELTSFLSQGKSQG